MNNWSLLGRRSWETRIVNKNEGRIPHSDDAAAALARSTHECVEPSSLHVPPDGVTCGRCGAQSPTGLDACPVCHCFLPGTQAARKSGIYAQHPPPDLLGVVDAMVTGVIADHGGEATLTTLEKAYIKKLADVDITVQLLAADIARRGLLTPSGGVRNVYDKFLAGLDRWDRLAQRIGLGRRARQVPNPLDFIQGHDE
jgi:hypothetical protein